MPIRVTTVEVCDARDDDSCNADDNIIQLIALKLVAIKID